MSQRIIISLLSDQPSRFRARKLLKRKNSEGRSERRKREWYERKPEGADQSRIIRRGRRINRKGRPPATLAWCRISTCLSLCSSFAATVLLFCLWSRGRPGRVMKCQCRMFKSLRGTRREFSVGQLLILPNPTNPHNRILADFK